MFYFDKDSRSNMNKSMLDNFNTGFNGSQKDLYFVKNEFEEK
jgi:hypothetical protein